MLNRRKKILFAAWSSHNPNYFAHQTWDAPLRKLFDVVSFDPQEEIDKFDKEEMNKRFLDLVSKEKPDYLLLWLIYDEFYPQTLFAIKERSPKTKVLNFCGDDDAQFYDYSAFNSFFVDYSLITHKEFIKDYKNKAFFSVGTNTEQFKPLSLPKKYDVSFIGTPKTDRREFVSYIMNKGIKIKVFGAGWEQYPEFKKIYGGFLNQEEYVKVINQSKINLCFNKNYLGVTHVIQKFFEINACNSFMLTEYCKGYSDLFKEGDELVMFKDSKELYQKIAYYLNKEKERERIAKNAYQKILVKYSSEAELKNIFKEIEKYGINIPKKKLPSINNKLPKIRYLSNQDLMKSNNEIEHILKDALYISFTNDKSTILPYRDLFQVTALEMFDKDISCCDSYLFARGIGDYIALYSNLAFKLLKQEEFSKLIQLEQLVVRKSFFINHISAFKEFAKGKSINIITKKNTTFVTRPFVRITKSPQLPYSLMKKIFWTKYEHKLKAYIYKRNPLVLLYLYRAGLQYLLGNQLLLKHLLEKCSTKSKKTKIISSLSSLFSC